MIIKTFKVKLIPNNKQKTRLNECASVSRFTYNWTLNKQKENYHQGNKFIQDGQLRKEMTKLKKTNDFKWLNNYSSDIVKQAIKDACNAYIRFFKGSSSFPRFKTKKKSKQSFYIDNVKIKFTKTHVRIEKLSLTKKKNKQKLNWVRLAEKDRVPLNCNYINPRITFDGLSWWLSVGVEIEKNMNLLNKEGIGIDLGVLDLAICSDGYTYKNINKSAKIKKIQKKLNRLQRKISKKYLLNKIGNSYIKTNNIIKLEKQLRSIYKKLTNIRQNYLNQITSEIISRKPMFIVIEDLNIKKMIKNKHLSKHLMEQKLYEFRKQLEYKSEWNNIKLIIANRFYPSSKLCCNCGKIKKHLKLSDRTYYCDCGLKIDRDFNASINLKNYGWKVNILV